MYKKRTQNDDQSFEIVPKEKYHRISLQLRSKLIKMIVQEKQSIYQTSKQLSIKHSTAKTIIRRFQKYGTIFARKSQKVQAGDEMKQIQKKQEISSNMIKIAHKNDHSESKEQMRQLPNGGLPFVVYFHPQPMLQYFLF